MSKDRFTLYQEMYKNEFDRRDKLTSQINIPVIVTTVIFGAFTYSIQHIGAVQSTIPMVIAIIAFIVLVASILVSAIFIILAFYGYEYEYIATPQSIDKYYNQLCEFYKNSANKVQIIEDAFETYLINDYCKCSETNTLNNDKRSTYLHDARTAIIVAIIASTISVGACNLNNVYSVVQSCLNKISTSSEVKKNGSGKPINAKASTAATTTAQN